MTPTSGSRRARRSAGPAAVSTATGSLLVAPQRWTPRNAGGWMPVPQADDDKYLRGVLGLRTGSARYPGAAVLGAEAAWRTGIGMLRYAPPYEDADGFARRIGLPSPAAAVLAARPETVFGEGRCDAWVLGSGTDPSERSDRERGALLELLAGDAPVVLDAGALGLVLDRDRSAATPIVVTPHQGEFLRLWQAAGLGSRPHGWPTRSRGSRERTPELQPLADAAAELSRALDVAVLLKGSQTVTATPGGQRLVSGPATPWLATAGTGDVLAGALGALLASHSRVIRENAEAVGAIAASAATLHDVAARIAAGAPQGQTATAAQPGGRPITAADAAAALPAATLELRRTREQTRRAHR